MCCYTDESPPRGRHHFGKLRGRFDRLQAVRGKVVDYLPELLFIFLQRLDGIPRDLPDFDRRHKLSVPVKMKIKIVGKDDIGQRLLVPVKLLLVLFAGQRFTDIFGFNVAYGNFFVGKNKIGGTAFDPGEFVCNKNVFQHLFQQILKIAPVGVFSRNTRFKSLINVFNVLRNSHVAEYLLLKRYRNVIKV